MKKLQIQKDGSWKYVFCQCNGSIITTEVKRKALDGEVHLQYFQNKYSNELFRMEV